jgi:hypothetical protein
VIRIFEQLRDLGYDCSYSSVWRHARAFAPRPHLGLSLASGVW